MATRVIRFATPLFGLLLAACGGASRASAVKTEVEWRTIAGAPLSPADSLIVITSLREAADDFVKLWRYHWEVSESYRALSGRELFSSGAMSGSRAAEMTWPPPRGIDTIILSLEDSLAVARNSKSTVAPAIVARSTQLHCHPDGAINSAYSRLGEFIIESGEGKRAVCPMWYPLGALAPWDERIALDNSIAGPLKPIVTAARSALLANLRRGAELLPGDEWIAGQRVRFAIDQRDTTEMQSALAGCHAARWWCTALGAYVLHERGEVLRSDFVFHQMLAEMPAEKRCQWSDLTLLLEEEDQKEYSKLTCAGRDSVNTTLWWLSDPVYGDRGNDRRAEHFARRILIELRGATSFQERLDMRQRGGGKAVDEMLVRFGWPTYSLWAGKATDMGHFSYLGVDASDMRDHGRFTTLEYAAPRFRLVPRLHAAQIPARALDFDWVISAAANADVYAGDATWWPREHYDRVAGPLIQLWSQSGMFRRQDSVLFAIAVALPAKEFPRAAAGDTLRGSFFAGTGPDSMEAQPAVAVAGAISVVRSWVTSEPQLMSLELQGRQPRGVVARTRFGIEPPQTLSQLQPGGVAVSAPVFIRPTTTEELPGDNPEHALSRMFATVQFRNVKTVGLYWETYGFSQSDSTDLSIRVERNESPPGLLRRLGFALGIGNRRPGTIAVEWSEAQPRRSMAVISGAVPIQGRVITLDISSLPPGWYTMIMSAARPGGSVATATRDFWLLE